MREILFRGKRRDNDEWVYGYYVCLNGKEHRIYSGFAETDCGDYYPDWYEVIPDTVGQFTGITDRNGTKVFEGDILLIHQFLFDGTEYEKELIGKVVYDNEQACYAVDSCIHDEIQKYMGYDDTAEFVKEKIPLCLLYGLHEESYTIIGNIFDNPELLEVTE